MKRHLDPDVQFDLEEPYSMGLKRLRYIEINTKEKADQDENLEMKSQAPSQLLISSTDPLNEAFILPMKNALHNIEKDIQDETKQFDNDPSPPQSSTSSSIINQAISRLSELPNSAMDIIGREMEKINLKDHFTKVLQHQANLLYICGTPGSGKSALVQAWLSDLSKHLSPTSYSPSSTTLACPLLLLDQIDDTIKTSTRQAYFSRYIIYLNCATQLNNNQSLFVMLVHQLHTLSKIPIHSSSCNNLETSHFNELQFLSFLKHAGSWCIRKWISGTNKIEMKSGSRTADVFFVIVLDEIDQIPSSLQAELHRLVQHALDAKSCFTLILLANAYDLFETTLAHLKSIDSTRLLNDLVSQLKSPVNHDPSVKITTSDQDQSNSSKIGSNVLRFKPYTASQLQDIIKYRLGSLTEQIFSKDALKFLTMKVAKLAGEKAGDVRILLQFTRQIIREIAPHYEKEEHRSNMIDVKTMMRFWQDQSRVLHLKSHVQNLSFIQKLALVSIILCLKENTNSKLNQVRYETVERCYKRIKSKQTNKFVQGELQTSVNILEGIGMLQIIKKRNSKISNIKFKSNMEEAWKELNEDLVVKTLL